MGILFRCFVQDVTSAESLRENTKFYMCEGAKKDLNWWWLLAARIACLILVPALDFALFYLLWFIMFIPQFII